MKAKVFEYISFRDAPFALVFAAAWSFALWIAEYTASEGVWIAAIAYVAFRASRWIVNALALFALRRLHSLALRKADELGVAIPEEPPPAVTPAARAAVAALLLAMFLAIIGMSIIATVPIVAWVGLPPLSAGFGMVGGIAFGAGAVVLAMIFGVPLILFKWTEKVAVNMRRLAVGINAVSDIIRARPLKALALVVNPRVG